MPKRILITAGPTREMLDPVRYLTNRSTGEMGYTLAAVARSRKHRVTLISGPTALTPPRGIPFVSITTARELQAACRKHFKNCDVLIMTAAVCDFTPQQVSRQKLRRTKTKSMLLKQTPDIVAGLAKNKGKRIVIGFCLETSDWIRKAGQKCQRKNLDGIVANYLAPGHDPFGKNRPRTAFVGAGNVRVFPRNAKKKIALELIRWVESMKRSKTR